jgi:hypothetical protein
MLVKSAMTSGVTHAADPDLVEQLRDDGADVDEATGARMLGDDQLAVLVRLEHG